MRLAGVGAWAKASIAEENATKGWEDRDNCNGMRTEESSHRRPWLSRKFTPIGKRGTPVACIAPKLAAGAASFLLLAAPVQAGEQIGPTSSAGLGISVSVAPRFALAQKTVVLGSSDIAGAGNGYCIATNGSPMPLPILLIRSVAGEDGHLLPETEELLSQCDAGDGQHLGGAPDYRPADLLIVRPD